jgi:lipopolysaccharide export system protein LptA
MVKITFLCNLYNYPATRNLLLVFLIISLSQGLFGQNIPASKTGKKKIEVIHSNEGIDEIERATGKRLTRLVGEVSLKHNDVQMTCDSAHFYTGFNQIKAYSRINMQQGDTLHLHGDSLFYDGATETASVDGHVELIDLQTHLFTNSVKYDVANKIARYNDHGRIINGDNTLTSIIGIYYVPQNLYHFKDSVKIVNPDYIMTADTMDYNSKTETAFFTGPSELKGDSLYLYCEKGWYDTKNDISRIWKNSVIDNKQQVIRGDSMYYDGVTGYGESFRNTTITDTTNNVIVKGNYAWYYKTPEKFMVTDMALFMQVSKKDTLFVHADTINAVTRTTSEGKNYRLMRAYFGTRIFSKDLQGKCDSLSYSFQDSVIRMYTEPVIWSNENQLKADSIAIITKNRQAERMELYNSAFVTSQVDTGRFNQVKGRSLTGYFRNNELYKINITGNAETIYFLLDGDAIVGVNKAKCARIEILVENGKITQINEFQNPEGTIDPPLKSSNEPLKLEGFSWLETLRPRKLSDLFKDIKDK